MRKHKAAIALALIIVIFLSSCATRVQRGDETLSLWTEDSVAKRELIAFVEAVTTPGSPEFIEPAERIAVFDFDGTLFCETDPNYFDYTLLVYRVLEDPEYRDKASDFERETAQKIVTLNQTGEAAKGLEVDHGKAVASAFKGMTLEQFNEYVQEFKKQAMPSYEGMTRGNGFYLPMLEIVRYLQDNEFTVYIISGTDRFIVRAIFYESVLGDIPPYQIVGSDENVVAVNQNGEDGLTYQISKGEDVVLGGEFMVKNLKMNKVSVIIKEIGVHPVLSFGNSTGDSSMADYTISNRKHLSLAFMLCCDDLERENGNEKKAQTMYGLCEEHGWIAISMKNDWTTIYGDEVTKTR